MDAGTVVTSAGFVLAVCMMYSHLHMVQKQMASNEEFNAVVEEEEAIEDEESAHAVEHIVEQHRMPGNHSVRMSKAHHNSIALKVDIKGLVKRHMSLENRLADINENLSPEKAAKAYRIMHVGRLYNVAGAFLWQTKAQSIMLVGVAVKLAIYNPNSPADDPAAAEQRFAVGIPIAICFSIQLIHGIFIKNFHHYSRANVLLHKCHHLAVAGRICLLAASVTACLVPLTPVQLMPLEALLIVCQSGLVHLQEETFPISSKKAHPMAGMSDALLYLHKEAFAENVAKRGGLAKVLEEEVEEEEAMEGDDHHHHHKGKHHHAPHHEAHAPPPSSNGG